ncbi:MAG TPA: hypothetical protein VHE60_14020 [Pyrinomonadaceae bacterium]|nr:hypothetical protein [Pyrinomonadaceae bacterium]
MDSVGTAISGKGIFNFAFGLNTGDLIMPIIAIKTEYAKEAAELAKRLGGYGVNLTDNSRKLLRLTVQGWYEEPPEWPDGGKETLKSVLLKIVDEAAEEEHVVAKKEKGEKVAFTDLFSSLATTGRKVLGKGFGGDR